MSLPKLRTPKLLRSLSRPAQSLVGIEAGENSLKFARWLGEDKGCWRFEFTELHATGDEIPTALDKTARTSLRQAGLGTGRAICVLSSPAVDIFPVSFTPRGSDTLESMVILNARERLSYPLEESVLDYSVLPDSVKRPGDEASAVLIFSAPRNLAETVLKRIDSTGLRTERLTTPGCVIAPLVKGDPNTRHLVINSGENATSIAVVQGGFVLLERVLPWSLQSLVLHIQAELELDDTQARRLLAELTSCGTGTDPLLEDPQGRETLHDTLSAILSSPFLELAHEAASCLSYCDSYLQHRSPASCLLVGVLASQGELRQVIEERLGIPVRGPSEGCRLPAWDNPQGTTCYATAACSALWPEDETDE